VWTKFCGKHRSGVAHELRFEFPGGGVPDFCDLIGASGEQSAALFVEGYTNDSYLVRPKRFHVPTGCCIPNANHAIAASRGDQFFIRTENCSVNPRVAMSLHCWHEFFAR